MADALGYDKGEDGKEDGDAVAEEEEKGGVEVFERGEPIPEGDVLILHATPTLVKQLTACVNYAYRGKNGKEGWTGMFHNPESLTLHAGMAHGAHNPKPSTLNPQPSILNPKP